MKKISLTLALALALSACSATPLLVSVEKSVPWQTTSTYSVGDYCLVSPDVYQSLKDSNQGHNPTTSPEWWIK